jgi:hypothetical protein
MVTMTIPVESMLGRENGSILIGEKVRSQFYSELMKKKQRGKEESKEKKFFQKLEEVKRLLSPNSFAELGIATKPNSGGKSWLVA